MVFYEDTAPSESEDADWGELAIAADKEKSIGKKPHWIFCTLMMITKD